MKQMPKSICIIVLAALLAACGVATPVPIVAATEPPTITLTPTTSLVPASPTLTAPAATLTPMPISSLPLSSAPNGLRIAYIVDGNLYVQNASSAPIQLTHSQGDGNPRFSDDGERILFYRNPGPFGFHILDLYSIHTDGTHEKLLVTGSLLKPLGYSGFIEIESSVYVHGTHNVLFSTRQLSTDMPSSFSSEGSKPNLDLLSVDIDTGEIKIVLPPGKGGNFVVSPDGSMVAIQASGHIDVVSIDGQVIRQNLVTYTPTAPHELIPDMFWTEDSTELLVTLPIDPVYQYTRAECTQDIAARSIWRYAVDGSAKIQTFLTPPPIGESGQGRYYVYFRISPDGSWISYNYYHELGCRMDETIPAGLYLGNLREGTAQFYAAETKPVWSADSTHFVYEVWDEGLFLGSVDEPPVWLDVSRWYVLGWADPTHYVAFYLEDGSVVGLMGEIGGEIIYFPTSVPVSSFEDFNRYYMFDFIYLDQER